MSSSGALRVLASLTATAALSACLDAPTGDELEAEDDVATDVAPDGAARAAARCNLAAPFGAPVRLAEINVAGQHDDGARLTPDELTMYFSSNRGGAGFDIFRANRPSRTAPFSSPFPVAGVNTAGDERSPSVTSNDRDLYVATSAGGAADIARAHRSRTSDPFGAPVPVAAIDTASDDADPYVLPNHTAVYFASARAGSPDLYRSARVNGVTQAPVLVLGGVGIEAAPVVTPDERTLFFASSRPGGVGDLDIYVATRPSTAEPFGAPVNVGGLNTTAADVPTWISADGCVLYVASGQSRDIFVATRGH